jgi:hypothetical protein
MARVASEVRVAGTGEIYVAPPATAAPTNVATALPAAWLGLGYTSDAGVTLRRSVDREGIPAWQSVTPVRFVYNALSLSVAAEFIQSNEVIMALYLNSGAFALSGTEYKADIPTVPARDTRSLVVEWNDSPVISRLYIPVVEVSETGDMTLNRGSAQSASMTFEAVAPNSGTTLATWFTNDANFA